MTDDGKQIDEPGGSQGENRRVALFSTAYGPVLSAALPLLATAQRLTQINALMQSSMMIGQLLGPAASGIVIAASGAQNVLYVTAGT